MNLSNHLQVLTKVFLMLLVTIVLFTCSPKKENSIDYPGQKPPRMVAELFATGLVSTDSIEHSAPVFSPDGKMVLWSVIHKGKRAFLPEMRMENGIWTKPALPSFSVDGKVLYFSSRRPLPPGYPQNIDIWIWTVEKEENSWGIPMPMDSTIMKGSDYAHSVSKNGTIFFSSPRQGENGFDIFSAKYINGKYGQPQALGNGINTAGYEDGPYIAPDESFLVFESERPESIEAGIDLYICFKQKNSYWGKPINKGRKINSRSTERFARFSPDGKYLFFGSNRSQSTDNIYFDLYWIDAKIIEDLKTKM